MDEDDAANEVDSFNSRYDGVLSKEQHALLGRLYEKTADAQENLDEVPVLQSYIVNPCATVPLSGYDHNFEIDDFDQASSPIEDPVNSAELSNWPQRLLHVGSMTSFEWQPGNRYGRFQEPGYNAISYTWGRYDIDSPYIQKKPNKRVMRHTRSVEIQGIEWSIPRIDPEHFAMDEFRDVIAQSCKLGATNKIDFLWVDVACIDQRNGPQKDMEIGRQAAIFRGAQNVFIWLTRLNEAHLQDILSNLVQSSDLAQAQVHDHGLQIQPTDEQVSWILRSRTALDNLFIDPWFTSLWTLQEAFLCPHAHLLGREATHLLKPVQNNNTPAVASLSNLFYMCDTLRRLSESTFMIGPTHWESPRPLKMKLRQKFLTEVNTMIIHRGFSALATGNPIALYGIASYRKTTNDVDRVYGIEQVFGFRLGTSAHGSKKKFYNRFILELQLGSRILREFPVLSQMHVFTEPVELGRGWRASLASRIPDLDLKSKIVSIEYQSRCTLNISGTNGKGLGAFVGKTCSFEKLRMAWCQVANPPPWEQFSAGDKSPQQICLDVCLNHKKPEFRHIPSDQLGSEGFEHTYPAVWGFSRDVPRGKEQHDMAFWLVQRFEQLFPGKALIVLLLGYFCDELAGDGSVKVFNIGLILIENELTGISYWRRLGFCIWECGKELTEAKDSPESLIQARENTSDWKVLSGLFG